MLANYLKDIGLHHYQVDAINYVPEAKDATTKRPDAANRMHRAHAAAAYDEWLQGKVESSRNDPRPSISNDDMKAEFAKRRAALLAKAMQ